MSHAHTHTAIHRHCSAQTSVDTPFGRLLLARTPIGLAGVWFEDQRHHPGPLVAPVVEDDPLLLAATQQLRRYFDGESAEFTLPLDLQGTPFQRAVWQALLAIGRGTTSSYAAIARQLGNATAVRAVGGAIGRNPVSVIVPCHRVIGSDGSLTGYAGGFDRKHAFLTLEKPLCAV